MSKEFVIRDDGLWYLEHDGSRTPMEVVAVATEYLDADGKPQTRYLQPDPVLDNWPGAGASSWALEVP